MAHPIIRHRVRIIFIIAAALVAGLLLACTAMPQGGPKNNADVPEGNCYDASVRIVEFGAIVVDAAAAESDAELISRAKQARPGKPQPGDYSSCVLYARARGFSGNAGGNTGAFNFLYENNNAKLVNNNPTAKLRPEITALAGQSNLKSVLSVGNFIDWDRKAGNDNAQANTTFGHMAVVELTESDRVVISEAGWGAGSGWRVLHMSDMKSGMYRR